MYIYQIKRDLLDARLSTYKGQLSGRVLDVGGGSGRQYEGLMEKPFEYLTLDINPDYHPNIVGSADAIPVGDNAFSAIICSQVLGDLLHPARAIKEFHRILGPGGRVLVTEGYMTELHSEPRDYWRFTPYGLSGLFEDAGFRIIKAEMTGGFFTVTTQMLFRVLINSLSLYRHKIFGAVFSKIFFIFGKLAILLDKVFRSKDTSKFGLDVIVLAESMKKNG